MNESSTGRIIVKGLAPADYDTWNEGVGAWFDDHSKIISDAVALRTIENWLSAGWFQLTGPLLLGGYGVNAGELMQEALNVYAEADRLQGLLDVAAHTPDMRALIALAMWAAKHSLGYTISYAARIPD